jgi:hypothetical protein
VEVLINTQILLKVGVTMSFVLSNELDYSLVSLKERKERVNEIIEKYDCDLMEYYENYQKVNLNQSDRTSEFDYVSKDLEKIADYLLYTDNKEQREKQKQEKFLNKRMTDNRKKKEYLTDNFTFVDEHKREYVKNVKVYGNVKVTEEDRKQYKELADTGNLIKILKSQIFSKVDSNGNLLSNEKLKKLRWYLIEIGKDEVAIKEQLKKYISFKNIHPCLPYYNLNHFAFSNIIHVKTLFDNYQLLKENTINKTESDFKLLLYIFDELTEKSIKEPILKKIFYLKINGYSQKEMIREVLKEFNIKINPVRLTQLTTQIIPSLIVDQYKLDYEEWFFTYIKKGIYKQCSSCFYNSLATNKYFTNDTTRKDGLFPICKQCRKKKK